MSPVGTKFEVDLGEVGRIAEQGSLQLDDASPFEWVLSGEQVEESDAHCPDVPLPASHDLLAPVGVDHLRRHEEVSPFRSARQKVV